MATIRQKKLAKGLTEGKINTAGELLVNVGYSKKVATHKPKEILDSIGVKEELEKLGFDAESAKKVVLHILKHGKEENRLRAADMTFKVMGEYAPEKHLVIEKKLIELDE